MCKHTSEAARPNSGRIVDMVISTATDVVTGVAAEVMKENFAATRQMFFKLQIDNERIVNAGLDRSGAYQNSAAYFYNAGKYIELVEPHLSAKIENAPTGDNAELRRSMEHTFDLAIRDKAPEAAQLKTAILTHLDALGIL